MRLPFFYGWVIVAVVFVSMAVGVNARTAFSLLFPPILEEFRWDRAVTAGAFSFGFLLSAVMSPLLGRLMDRAGPRLVMEMGVFMLAAGLLLAPLTTEAWHLYATLGVLVGGGSVCLGYSGQSLFLPNWFVRRRGLATGIAFAGVGVGSIILFPVMQWAIETYGWRSACWTLGLVALVLLAPINLLLRKRPEDMGLLPDGDAAPGRRLTGRSRAPCARGASGGSPSAIFADCMPGTPCRCTRRSTSPRSASAPHSLLGL
jgi:MFS family permease